MLERVSARLRESDMVQIMLAYAILLLFVLLFSWPQGSAAANNSWYSFVQGKTLALVLLSLAYGSLRRGREEVLVTLSALLALHALSMPLEVATYAATYPLTPLWWPLTLGLLHTVAFFALGLALGQGLESLRLRFLMPLVAPGVLGLCVFMDVYLNLNLFNPLQATQLINPPHAVLMLLLSLLLLPFLWRLA